MVCFVSFVGYSGGTIYVVALPELSQDFQVAASYVNFSITIYFIGLMIGTLLSGPASEMVGRTRALLFFLALAALSALVCAVSPSISWFLGARLLEGIGHAGGPILAMALVADRYEGRSYHTIISFLLIMISLGPGVSPIFGSLILHFFDWRVIFYLLAIFDGIALGLVLLGKGEPRGEQKKIWKTLQGYAFFIKHPFFPYFCLMIGSLYGAFYVFLILSPYIFRLDYGWDVIDFAWVGLAMAIANSLGSFLHKELNEKIGSRRVFFLGGALMLSAILMLFVIGKPFYGAWILMLVAIFVVGDSLISSCLTANALKMGVGFSSNIAASLVSLVKVYVCALVLVSVSFLPETLETIRVAIVAVLFVCVLGYLKVRKAF